MLSHEEMEEIINMKVENASENTRIIKTEDLNYLREKIFRIDGRQKTGYETFRNVKQNQEVMIGQINGIKTAVLCLCVSIFALTSVVIAIAIEVLK